MNVTISPEAREVLITELDVATQQAERDHLQDEIKLLEYAIRQRKDRISQITSTLCLIQLSASHQLCRRTHEAINHY